MTPSAEDLLRTRLHEVDDLQPPDDGFELRVLRAGRERQQRRQSWTRGLVAAAAAVAVGAVAVPSLTRVGGAGGTASSGAAESRAAASQGPDASVPADQGAPGGAGSTPADALGRSVEITLVSLRSSLARDYPESFTALVLDPSTSPRRVVLHMTTDSPAAQRTVRDAVPSVIEVDTEQSAFPAAACRSTLARVAADRDTLTRQGYAVGPLSCDNDGRVVLPITNLVTAEQLQVLKVRYGDPVTVVQAVGVPTTP